MKHVFVSSTFKDMQFERDALHGIAAMNINEALSPYGEEVYFGDLRWGVNTTSLDSDEGCRRVLEVCLDEIDDCRPYMIVLIGERYGWIPDGALIRDTAAIKGMDILDEMSVTQLEIEYGALLSDACRGRVFFYFRELDTAAMTEAQRADYLAESDRHRELINALKARIMEIYPEAVRSYTARFDAETQSVVGLEGFLRAVERDLSGAFLADIKEEESLPWQERAMRSAERHFAELSRCYHPVNRRPSSFCDGTFHTFKTLMRFVKGESGTGKSAFIAHCFTEASETTERRELLPFVLGLDKYSTCEMDYFKILLYKIEELCGIPHTETTYGEAAFDGEIFDRIVNIDRKVDGEIHSYIDNCSYELQNALSVRILDEHLKSGNIAYLGEAMISHAYLDFTIAYSANERMPILPPLFDFSRTYILGDVSREDQIPLIHMILRQRHKELDGSVIAALTQKEEALSPFYLKLAVDRMLMLDRSDFAQIRAMGDGMDNINRYQIAVVESLPETSDGMAKDLVCRVGERVDKELVMRLFGILTYGGTRMNEPYIESVFRENGWAYSSLSFALATRSLSAVLNYNPRDKSYAITSDSVFRAMEELLEKEGYTYVARALYTYVHRIDNGAFSPILFRTASYVGADFLADFYVTHRENKKQLLGETDWLVRRRGGVFAADVLMRVTALCSNRDFSFLLSGIPTACLTFDDREIYETFLGTLLDSLGELSSDEGGTMRNSLAVMARIKLTSMKMTVNTSDAAPDFHAFVDAGYRDYPMTARARLCFDILYYRFLALEAFYSMNIVTPESDTPVALDLIDEIDSTEERLLLHSHLYAGFAAYLQRSFDPSYSEYLALAKRGYALLAEQLREDALDSVTADDVAAMIDCLLDDRDSMLRADMDSVSVAIRYMVEGQTRINSRLLKYFPKILYAAKYMFDEDGDADFADETVNIIRRLCAASRAVAGSAMTVDDCLYAVVQMEQTYDILSDHLSAEDHLELIHHLNGFVRLSLSASDGEARVFYRCYLAIRRLFHIFELYEMNDAYAALLGYVSSLEIADADTPILSELFMGALIYRYGDRENDELRDRLRELADTLEQDPQYAAQASAYSPELMGIREDIRTPEEIAADDAYAESWFSYNENDGDSDWEEGEAEEYDGDGEYGEDGALGGLSSLFGGDGEPSIEDMIAALGQMGLSPEDLLADEDDEP